jgi:hypothetical protein
MTSERAGSRAHPSPMMDRGSQPEESGSMELQFVRKSPGFVAGAFGPLVVSVWDSTPTEQHARDAVSVLASVARVERRMLVMAVVGRDTPPPDSIVRDIVAKEMARVSANVAGMAQVIEGLGFRAATMRAVLTGMGIVIKPSYPQKVCLTIDEASEFLFTHADGRLTAQQMLRAARQMRD